MHIPYSKCIFKTSSFLKLSMQTISIPTLIELFNFLIKEEKISKKIKFNFSSKNQQILYL